MNSQTRRWSRGIRKTLRKRVNSGSNERIMLCFLSVRPTQQFYNFIKSLQNDKYEVSLCLDDITYSIPGYDGMIKIIKVDTEECERAGFKGSVLWCKDRACSRDKALYHFCVKDRIYTSIWFIEDDVFIPTKNTISNIDLRHPTADLLCPSNEIKRDADNLDWHWRRLYEKVDLPWAKSMICAVRVSKRMLDSVRVYASRHKTLFLDEALFNTLALQNRLKVVNPTDLTNIVYERDWKIDDININYLYHPVKGDEKQLEMRNMLALRDRSP